MFITMEFHLGQNRSYRRVLLTFAEIVAPLGKQLKLGIRPQLGNDRIVNALAERSTWIIEYPHQHWSQQNYMHVTYHSKTDDSNSQMCTEARAAAWKAIRCKQLIERTKFSGADPWHDPFEKRCFCFGQSLHYKHFWSGSEPHLGRIIML